MMIPLGIVLLLGGVALIWLRSPLTRTSLSTAGSPVKVYIANQSQETTVLWIGVLIAVLGIGLILIGAAKSKLR